MVFPAVMLIHIRAWLTVRLPLATICDQVRLDSGSVGGFGAAHVWYGVPGSDLNLQKSRIDHQMSLGGTRYARGKPDLTSGLQSADAWSVLEQSRDQLGINVGRGRGLAEPWLAWPVSV